MRGIKRIPLRQQRDSARRSPYLADRSAGIGTLRVKRRLPGFIGPYPSTSPDKACSSVVEQECNDLARACQESAAPTKRAGLIRQSGSFRSILSLERPVKSGLNRTRFAHRERFRAVSDSKSRNDLRLVAAPRGQRGLTCQLATLRTGCGSAASWRYPPALGNVDRQRTFLLAIPFGITAYVAQFDTSSNNPGASHRI
jgi:hypothetical protein